MKIISNLPENHICYCYVESKGYYYNNLGLVSRSQMSLNDFFSLIDGDDLVLYFVDTIIDEDTITFNSKEISRIHFNSQYNEIEHVDERKVSAFIKHTSTDVMLTYMAKIL